MKLLHTGDWHLGKKLFKESRLPEQKLFLEWLFSIIENHEIDILIIAGDVFDTPSPPAEASKLFFDFLHQVSSKTTCHIVAIAGNHDSGAFLEAPKAILKDLRITLCGKINGHSLTNLSFPKLSLTLLPFFRSYDILSMARLLIEQGIIDRPSEKEEKEEEGIITQCLEKLFHQAHCQDKKNILIAHHLFGSMEKVEMGGSEQAISLSGLNSIPTNILEKYFDYVALGHIHKKYTVKDSAPKIRYSGAPLPFRFSERGKKSITVINLDSDVLQSDEIEIPEFRRLITIQTAKETLELELKKMLERDYTNELPPYLEVQLTVQAPEVGVADFIRDTISNSPIQLISLKVIVEGDEQEEAYSEVMSELPSLTELFEMFYASRYPTEPTIPESIRQSFMQLLSSAQTAEDKQ